MIVSLVQYFCCEEVTGNPSGIFLDGLGDKYEHKDECYFDLFQKLGVDLSRRVVLKVSFTVVNSCNM